MEMQENKGGACRCGHHKVMAILVILFGLTFLFGAMGGLSAVTVSYTWPILVIIAGLTKFCRCCNRSM